MPITVAATVAGMEALKARIDSATRQLANDVAHMIQAESMKTAPRGVAGNSTNASGDLARSIDVESAVGQGGTYLAQVGPTVIYGRQRELGGDIYPQRAASLVFTKFGTTIYTTHVYQEGDHYMERGLAEALPLIPPVVSARMGAAIVGS